MPYSFNFVYWLESYDLEYSRLWSSLRIFPSMPSSESPQHFGQPHRKFSSRHHLACFPSSCKSWRQVWWCFMPWLRAWKGTRWIHQTSDPVVEPYNLSPFPARRGDDLQRLSTLEGDARIGSLNFTAFAEDGPGKLCILQQFGFRYVADFFPHELLSYIAKFASKDAVRVPW